MALELRQQLKLTQQLIMTPQLQMAIKLLQLSRLELMETIHQELEENPALEEVQETTLEDSAPETSDPAPDDPPSTQEVTMEEKIQEDIDWSNYLGEYNSPGRVNYESESKESPKFEAFIARQESLNEHLLWQLLLTRPTEEEEKIGSIIIGNLNSDGYLDVPIEDLTRMSESSPTKVRTVLELIQAFDPIGVCARDLKECLMLQAKYLDVDNTLVTEIINSHLGNLEKKNYKAICRALKVNMDDVIAAVNIIRGLEPRPGRQFSEETAQ